jgi:hypothetical protein
MLGPIGYFASSKGMTTVPNIIGLTESQAVLALQTAGLGYSLGVDVATENSSLDTLVASQSPSAGAFVQYESIVIFSLYEYIPPTFSFAPSFTFAVFGPPPPTFTFSVFTPSFSFAPSFSFSVFGR